MTKRKKRVNSRDQNATFGLLVGLIIGVVLTLIVAEYIGRVSYAFFNLLLAFFLLVSILAILFLWFKEKIFSKIFGESNPSVHLRNDIARVYGILEDKIIEDRVSGTSASEQKKTKNAIRRVLKLTTWAVMRSWAMRFLLAIFIGIGGLFGSILLYNQNILLRNQNEKFEIQNKLLMTQNDKIESQNRINEITQKSSLVFLLSNLLDKVDEEINDQERRLEKSTGSQFSLSKPLISRIIALSKSFSPYKLGSNGNKLSSPERGQLFISVLENNLDSFSQNTVVERGDFNYTIATNLYLEGANLNRARLNNSNLTGSRLQNAKLNFAWLNQADLSHSILRGAEFRGAHLHGTSFLASDLSNIDFKGASIWDANLRGAKLTGADLFGVSFLRVNLSNTIVSYEQLKRARLIRECKLKPEVEQRLRRELPCLFTGNGCNDNKINFIGITTLGDTLIGGKKISK